MFGGKIELCLSNGKAGEALKQANSETNRGVEASSRARETTQVSYVVQEGKPRAKTPRQAAVL
jgi:hypothetical protein